LEEKTFMPLALQKASYLNAGAPIGRPRAFASLLRAMKQPSLLDNTAMGFPSSAGLNTRSQEA
jgi:hypothetical protein